MTGLTIGIIALGLTALLCGIGSGLGLKATGKASAGVLAEDPSKFSKVIVLTLLPATQGLYGFAIAIIGAIMCLPTAANLAGAGVTIDPELINLQITAQGWNIFWACLPMMLGGAISAYLQGRTAASTIIAVGKRSEVSKAFLFPAMIEFYALLGLAASVILFSNIPVAEVVNIHVELPAVQEAASALLGTLA